MVSQRRTPFLWLGQHRALDFLNTHPVVHGTLVDLLPDFPSLIAWLDEAGVLPAGEARKALARWTDTPAAATAVDDAHALRASLRATVEHLRARRRPGRDAVAMINVLLRRRVGHAEIVGAPDGFARRLHVQLDHPGQLLVPLAECAADLLCDVDPSLIKRCANPACVLYFYDASKNHARRWCSMETCGNRMKSAAHYRRRRASARRRPRA